MEAVEIDFSVNYALRFLGCCATVEIDQPFSVTNSASKDRKIFPHFDGVKGHKRYICA
jgi:hypothetical protein